MRRTDGGLEFAYLPDYLEGGHVPLATTLPLTDEPIVRPGRSVPPYFAGLLPEGRRLTVLRRTFKVSADDELSLLIAAGGDPVGDVSVAVAGAVPDTVGATVAEISWADIRFADLLVEHGMVDPSSLAGVQDKVSGRMLGIPLTHGGRAHLLKLTPPEFPRLVENEAFFLHHAARLPIPVVEWQLVTDRDGASGLLITRFDRVSAGPSLVRLPVEDGTQLMGRYPGDKYNLSTEELTRAVAEACTSVPLATRSILIQVVWSWLTGNGDLHGKNISVVGRTSTAGGTLRPEVSVAPLYDIPSTWPYRDHTMALPLGGRTDVLTRAQVLRFAQDVGLPVRAAQSALDTTMVVASDAIDDIRAGGAPWRGKARDDLVKALSYRLDQLR